MATSGRLVWMCRMASNPSMPGIRRSIKTTSGWHSSLLAVTLAVVTGGVVLVLLGWGAANPILVRMGLRNMTRRPSQTLVLLCGLALSTAVMTASFGLSDSITASEVQQRLARMGAVDESITGPFTQVQVDSTLARLRQESNVAAASAIFFAPQSPTVTLLRTGLSVHGVDLYAVPPDFDQVYGAITNSRDQVVHFADLRSNGVFVSATLAENLNIQPGDTLQLSFEPSPSVVRAVLSKDIAVTAGEAIGNATPKSCCPLHTPSRLTRNRPIPSASRIGGRVAWTRAVQMGPAAG